MRKICTLIILFGSIHFTLNAQFEDYKYIVVPIKFATFKNPNAFQTSTLIKHYMTKEGFNVIYDNAFPEDLEKNRCLALFTDLMDESSLFKTKASLVLKDCKGEVVFKTVEGQTKVKELDKAYKEVITTACTSFKGLEHNYQAKEATVSEEPITVSFKDDVKSVENSSVLQKEEVEKTSEIATDVTEVPINDEVEEDIMAEDKKEETKVQQELLRARVLENGYELVTDNGEVVYVLEETSIENVFLVNQEDVNGVILKKDEKWYLEYKDGTDKVIKELQIKF